MSAYLIECPRCGSAVEQSDMKTDPRWGDVCDDCQDELRSEYGEPERTEGRR